MIPVKRTSTPDILKQNADKWLKKLQEAIINLEEIENDPTSSKEQIQAAKKKVKNAQDKYNPGKTAKHKINTVKQPLYDMFSGKCAFCERKVEISAGRIEHFRPKSQYVDLTFDWNNLLYACEVCNNAENKGNKFPLDCDGSQLLIDPTDEDCDIYQYLEFYWDKEAQLAHVNGKDKRGKVVAEILSLNRTDLIQYRSRKLKALLVILRQLRETRDKKARDEDASYKKAIECLIQSCKFDEEYTAFALFYILPYLAHAPHALHISEAIEMIKEVGKRSPSYAKFARIDDLSSLNKYE
ncbi:TIGR02646 family protein [Anabaena sp. FACHB-1250]|uniref:retron system putative HNH endonuclease n=1 Tax=Anabaena sp. FACHB-1250 TaxID=2692770 RepID=UPI0016813162|nr:retron system putative HNH endonuclease [Anabaena sp. FACHB-1250]MBD2141828.1 TIGR02646 family protein [Anabaena sp. FACHB-1250]